MAKKKREYQSKEFFEELVNNYINENEWVILQDLLKNTGYESLEDLRNAEYYCAFGLDCGLVYLTPTNSKMFHEWTLDNGKYEEEFLPKYPFRTQSTTLQKIQADRILNWINDMGFGELRTKVWID